MDLTARDWIELIGVVILPIVGFIFTLILTGVRERIKELNRKVEALEKEQAAWHADLPEKYARRDDLERTFNQLSQAILRVDEKLDRILHNGLRSE